jgi:hypothetical protein
MPSLPKKLLDKRIPTILGLVVLVAALVAGIFFLGDGPGIFAPRATPGTTPQKIKVTNVTDNSFSVSFLTDEKTPGFVNYGTEANKLNSQASDDRDQLAGTVADYQLHHITVRGLQPTTNYYYTLGTGSNAKFDNNGQPFMIKTAARNGAPAAAKTIYGSISNQTGNPAEGAIVYVSMANAGEMSSLVKSSGSWAVPLSNARTKDGSGYAQISDTDNIILTVQGVLQNEVISYSTTVTDSQPVPTLTFGQTTPPVNIPTPDPIEKPDPTPDPIVKPTPDATPKPTPEVEDESNRLDQLEESTQTQIDPTTTVDLQNTEPQTVQTSQPLIVGKAAPNVAVTIKVNSETQIEENVIADENGDFQMDIAALSQNLEPGEHEVTYSYTDPTTGELISKTISFTVEDPTQQLAQAEPFGSGNPVPPATPTPTPATQSTVATDEGRISMPATEEAVPVSGSVGTTMALVFGGLFFIISGIWSFWISQQLGKDEVEF